MRKAGFKHSAETREKIRASLMNHAVSQETKDKLKEAGKGRTAWNKGVAWSQEIRKRVSETLKQKGIEPKQKFVAKKEDHWNWKGGKTKENKLERQRFRKQIVPLVLKRDNYTCQICGVRGVELHVNHIKAWAEYPELRFEMSNCESLCVACHYQATYGKTKPKKVTHWGRNKTWNKLPTIYTDASTGEATTSRP